MVSSGLWYGLSTVVILVLIRKIREYTWGRCRSKGSLRGKTFLITGANCGIGYETAKALAIREANVILACRDVFRARMAIEQIRQYLPLGRLTALELDLSDFNSIKAFAQLIRQDHNDIHCLINNAGLATNELLKTKQNFEIHFGVNYLGHFLLTNLLLDVLSQNNAKIINVTSQLHEKGVIDLANIEKAVIIDEETSLLGSKVKNNGHVNPLYCNSKLANLYFAMELEKMGYESYAICPGFTYTNLFRNHSFKWYQYVLFMPVAFFFLRSAEQGAQSVIKCASENLKTQKDIFDSRAPTIRNGYYFKNCKFYKSKVYLDEELSKELWIKSRKLCDL
ncbi:retinol dehydrogenase 11-like [Ctenocephalides felis]|uniref:retinol dehydrogenase 11-like n=1 Tax=Ctenocephalides felis TaxID=7515 RepID=UPI000E6E5B52|nr:retinol dehydrogenase 11-like [Ctenocephalides felis]